MKRERLLLHACCATCLLHPYESLKKEYDVHIFFYNPNIHPFDEYRKRLSDIRRVCGLKDIPLFEGTYDLARWYGLTVNNKSDKEGGTRCSICFKMRLDETAKKAIELGIRFFGTTLSVSPHKNSDIIGKTGKESSDPANIEYIEKDFKKKDGFKKTLELSKRFSIYHQDYCGCVYSIRP